MTYTVFKTPGLLDVRAITTFGLNVKPGVKSPIGYFGTGLKMAIALLVRTGHEVVLSIGQSTYVFYSSPQDFRGEERQFVRMKRRDGGLLTKWTYEKLPFTTDLAKNWELWMAYRELESNTIDEGGSTVVSDVAPLKTDVSRDETWIWVNGDDFADVHRHRETVFLPDALREPTVETQEFQIFQEPSDYVFYRGMRVMELSKRSIFTYNILTPSQLTEDRTLKDGWMVGYWVAAFIAKSEDRALVNRFLNATDRNWEYELPLDSVSGVSQTFLDVVAKRKKAGGQALLKEAEKLEKSTPLWGSSRVGAMYASHSPPPIGRLLADEFEGWLQRQNEEFIHDLDREMLEDVLSALRRLDVEVPEEAQY